MASIVYFDPQVERSSSLDEKLNKFETTFYFVSTPLMWLEQSNKGLRCKVTAITMKICSKNMASVVC